MSSLACGAELRRGEVEYNRLPRALQSNENLIRSSFGAGWKVDKGLKFGAKRDLKVTFQVAMHASHVSQSHPSPLASTFTKTSATLRRLGTCED